MEELKKFGLKATLPRLRILQLLETNNQHHMSAEDVYKALLDVGKDIGLATIYRVLTQFEAAGLVIRHHFDDNSSVFELNAGHHHDHLLCIKCGKVIEFVDDVIEEHQRTIAKQHGFKITNHYLYIYGVCSTCYDKRNIT
ncbi:MAG TPA: ferric iron uptake transcriptional regulator [Thioploca sp.]|nr:ferric iron uptake transcriptional regulator [Thioploca sp.]